MRTQPITTFVPAPLPRFTSERATGADLDDLFALDDRPVAGREATRIARALVARETCADASDLTVRLRPPRKQPIAAVFRAWPNPAIWFYGKRNQTLGSLLHEVAHAIRWHQHGGKHGWAGHGAEWRDLYHQLAVEFGMVDVHSRDYRPRCACGWAGTKGTLADADAQFRVHARDCAQHPAAQ